LFFLPVNYQEWTGYSFKLLLALTFRISVTDTGNFTDKAIGRGWGKRRNLVLVSSPSKFISG
jgi:hypothetical protein